MSPPSPSTPCTQWSCYAFNNGNQAESTLENAHNEQLLAYHYTSAAEVQTAHGLENWQISHATGVLYGRRRRLDEAGRVAQ